MSVIKFGTSGWRAIIAEDFTFGNVRVAVQAIAGHLKAKGNARRGVVVGYDPRFLSPEFSRTAAEVLAANKIPSFLSVFFMPTPVVAYEILRRRAAGGINFTASHNPPLYNGLKFSPAWGGPALPEETADIEQRCVRIARKGRVRSIPDSPLIHPLDARKDYFRRLRELVDLKAIRRAGLRVVLDTMWGAGAGYLDAIFKETGCRVSVLHTERDVLFGGASPEPSPVKLNEMMQVMRRERAHLGLAVDGDADRFGIVDADGTFYQPNEVVGLLLDHLIRTRGWRGPAVRSLATTHWIDAVARLHGVGVIETPVGFKYIGEAMLREQGTIGGEESGGLTIRGHVPEKDGILACLLMAEMVAVSGRSLRASLRALQARTGVIYSDKTSFRLPGDKKERLLRLLHKRPPGSFGGLDVDRTDTRDGFKFVLSDGSWLLIRFSGTEPLLRYYWESGDRKMFHRLAVEGERLVRKA